MMSGGRHALSTSEKRARQITKVAVLLIMLHRHVESGSALTPWRSFARQATLWVLSTFPPYPRAI